LREIASEDLLTAMQKLQLSLDEKNSEESNANMQSFMNEQSEYLKKLERSINIFKRLQIEQMMDELVIKSEDIRETQEAINSNLDSLSSSGTNPQDSNELDQFSRQEENLSKGIESVKETAERLFEKMLEQPDLSTDKLEYSINSIEQKQLKDKLSQLSQSLGKEDISKSSEKGKQIEEDLKEVENNFKESKQELTKEQQDAIVKDLQKSSHEILQLSVNQENVRNDSKSLTVNSDKFENSADNILSGLSRTVSRIVDISEKSFFITPELGASLEKAANSMQNSLRSLEARNKDASVGMQTSAMEALNSSIMELRQAAKNAQQSGDGVGFEEFLKRMNQMAGKQKGINQQTMSIPQQGGSMSAEQRAAMQRIMREQELVRRSMENLREELQGMESMKDRLGNLESDMKKILDELTQDQFGKSTIDIQEKILSRMLDAQKSLNRRDFSKKRQGVAANEYNAVDPGSLPAGLGESVNDLEELLIKALKEGYNRDFEEMIKKYFEILNKKRIKK